MNRYIKHHGEKKAGFLKNRVASKNRQKEEQLELPAINKGHGLERAESSKLSLHGAGTKSYIKQLKINKYAGQRAKDLPKPEPSSKDGVYKNNKIPADILDFTTTPGLRGDK